MSYLKNKQSEDKALAHIEFELGFFSYIAGTNDFEVIAVPDFDGSIPSEEEFNFLSDEYKKQGLKLLYRISGKNCAVVCCKDLIKIGIVPEDNQHGFPC